MPALIVTIMPALIVTIMPALIMSALIVTHQTETSLTYQQPRKDDEEEDFYLQEL